MAWNNMEDITPLFGAFEQTYEKASEETGTGDAGNTGDAGSTDDTENTGDAENTGSTENVQNEE